MPPFPGLLDPLPGNLCGVTSAGLPCSSLPLVFQPGRCQWLRVAPGVGGARTHLGQASAGVGVGISKDACECEAVRECGKMWSEREGVSG